MNYNLIFIRIREKDQEAFRRLFAHLYEGLVNYANAYLQDQESSEDLVQEVFIYLWENAGRIHIQSSLKAYLFTAVRNRCINQLKSVKITDRAMVIDAAMSLSSNEMLESHNEEERVLLQQKIMNVVENLPEKMKQVVKLKFMDNYEHNDIASELGISVNTVKTQLKRAKLKISEMIILLIIVFMTAV